MSSLHTSDPVRHYKYRIAKRMTGMSKNVLLARLLGLGLSVILICLLFVIAGKGESIGKGLEAIFIRAFSPGARNNYNGLQQLVFNAVPLICAAIAVSFAFKMKVWNIGAEGQILMGSLGAAMISYLMPGLPQPVTILLMVIAAVVFGGLWASISGVLKAKLNVNETLTTLMFNYIAKGIIAYLLATVFRDPFGHGREIAMVIDEKAKFLPIGDTKLHWGLVIVFIIPLLYYFIIHRSKWGYEIRVTGENYQAAKYAGINSSKNIILVMALSGALAGLIGYVMLAGGEGRIQPELGMGIGFTAIIIAWLARLNPFAIIGMGLLFTLVKVGGSNYLPNMTDIPVALADAIQGVMLFALLATDFMTRYKIERYQTVSKKEEALQEGVHA